MQLLLCPLTGPPVFESLLSDFTTKIGQTIKLTCKVTGSPKPVVSWLKGRIYLIQICIYCPCSHNTHWSFCTLQAYCTWSGLITTTVLHLKSDVHLLDGLPLEDDPRHIITADRSGTCSLILDSLTAQDSGQYACYAKSSMGSAATLAKVVVQGEYGCILL